MMLVVRRYAHWIGAAVAVMVTGMMATGIYSVWLSPFSHLARAVAACDADQTFQLLRKHPELVEETCSDRMIVNSILMDAIECDVAVLDALLDAGADPDCTCNGSSHTLLTSAIIHELPDHVESLLSAGASYELTDPHGRSPLQLAIRWGRPDIVEKLVAVCDGDRCAEEAAEGIGIACWHSLELVLLLERSYDIDLLAGPDVVGYPLHSAVSGGNRRIIDYLIERGLDVNQHDKDGDTPLHVASRHGDIDVIATLLEAGADPNARDRMGRTPLHLAAGWTCCIACADELIAAGASIDLKTDRDTIDRSVSRLTPREYGEKRLERGPVVIGCSREQAQSLIDHLRLKEDEGKEGAMD